MSMITMVAQEVMRMPDNDSTLASELKAQQDAPMRDFEEVMTELDQQGEGVSPLASGLHHDGTIHIYVNEADSGLSIGLEDDGTLLVRVDESKRAMRVSV